jgi:hypothetical protein
MADVINLSDRRKKPPPTLEELAAFCVEQVMEEWERFAKANRLNDFFINRAGLTAKQRVNYLSDLNEVAQLEKTIKLEPCIMAPDMAGSLGWRASFKVHEPLTASSPEKIYIVQTPDMPSEGYARCCNILIFKKLSREMLQRVLQKP